MFDASTTTPRRTVAAAVLVSVAALAIGCAGSGTNATGPASPSAPSATSGPAGTTAARPGGTARATTTTDATDDPNDTTATTEDATDTTEPEDAGAERPACSLLTEGDARAAFGEAVVAGDQRQDECWWSTANDLKTVNLIRREEDVAQWRRGYQNSQWKKIDLGDEGYTGLTLDSNVFRIGDTTYEINVIYSTKGDPGAALTELTDAVVARL